MEKTIKIDGKDVRFRASGALPILYRSLTGREYFADINKNIALVKAQSTELVEELIWVLAKCADKSIADKYDWYDSFEEFNLFEVYAEINDLLLSTMQTTKKQ